MEPVTDKQPLRFRWDHLHPVHRTVVKRANAVLANVPLAPKYRVAMTLRRSKPPYSLVKPGDVVVQVGAPSDTLHSGRSRGMHLALRTAGGRAIIIEPDPASASAFETASMRLGLDHVEVVNSGAWHSPSSLDLLVDRDHPATNFVAGTVDYDAERMADFDTVTVPVDTVDSIVERVIGAHGPVRLLSITTNNSEREILQGVSGLIHSGLEYLCLARTGEGYDEIAQDLGFERMAYDDRGYTYRRR